MTYLELLRDVLMELIRKSGVREWEDDVVRVRIPQAAVEITDAAYYEEVDPMAVTAVFRKQFATVKTFKKTGGSAAMTPSTLANGAYWQSAKLDLGTPQPCRYNVKLDVDLAATPTAGNVITFWWNPSSSGTPGTDNCGGCSGMDSSYTGYSSNAAASVKQLVPIGEFNCTTQTSHQRGMVAGQLVAPDRYGSLVMLNGAGSAFASDTDFCVTFTPEEDTSEPS